MGEQTTLDVGKRIRAMREQRGLSLRTLAEQSGLSFNAISLIERGENSPTVSSLHMLAKAMRVSINKFFETGQEESVVFSRPEGRLRSESKGVVMESLGIGLRYQQTEPFLISVAPGAGNLSQPITHAGEEFVYCLEGELDYCIKDRSYKLEPGCSLLFDSSLSHAFLNSSSTPALLMMVFNAGTNNHLIRRLHIESHQDGGGQNEAT